jgi:8-oxo-dGTP pyrophosphatase MutT (NUDIX family)
MTPPKPLSQDQRPPIPSATVMVLRDGAAGLEVFMLVRNRVVDFASGALVFPGGKNDAQDSDAVWSALAPVSAPHPPLPYWVAAMRETFEETGLLLAHTATDGAPLDAARAIQLTAVSQSRVASGGQPFADLIAGEGLTLATDRLVPFAHWVTPESMPKRFDTHFFLAAAPEGQVAVHDGGETVESLWISPRQAISDGETGTRTLVPATTLNLELLAKSTSVSEAFAQARARRIVTVMPTVSKADGGVRISIPSNAGYDTTSVFVPRPTPA